MNEAIRQLEPQAVWKNFADLNAIPRPSKKEDKVRSFILDFGKKLGLQAFSDSTGNVIIKKPATPGMENRKTIVLQGHLDMVTQKNNDVDHDFDTQGIEMYVDGDWVRAKGTTLGADNGLGVSAIMAVLESTSVQHPAIEALFTYDEETGMTGALKLDEGLLEGEILLNLDTEEDDEIDIGCAGGVDITATKSCLTEKAPADTQAFRLSLTGLNGGHSGIEIHKGLGNANKLMNRVLFAGYREVPFQIAAIAGGGLRNAIPRESVVELVLPQDQAEAFENAVTAEISAVKAEYQKKEERLSFRLEQIDRPQQVISATDTWTLLQVVYALHNGVYRMSPDIADLVETSNNVARVTLQNGYAEIQCLTRSSVESGKQDLTNMLFAAFELGGFRVEASGAYPGWQPDPDSQILKVVADIYEKKFKEKPAVVACHAGLECGILLSHYPDMEAVSFGPTIKGAHSPDERASISSCQKFWGFLKDILAHIPEKDRE